MSRTRTLVRRAMATATPSMETLAASLGLSTSALRRYRLGNREPSREVIARLAKGLRGQARRLEALARILEGVVQHQGGQDG